MTSFDEGYFNWLWEQVEPVRNLNPRQTHRVFLAHLHQTPFVARFGNDVDRAADGRALRGEFLGGYDVGGAFGAADCSVLEMLVAFSRRAAYESYGEADDWFWHMLGNLGLADCTDDRYGEWNEDEVNRALVVFMRRQYLPNGQGGLFPVRFTRQDQRRVELRYQLSTYILEGNGP